MDKERIIWNQMEPAFAKNKNSMIFLLTQSYYYCLFLYYYI